MKRLVGALALLALAAPAYAQQGPQHHYIQVGPSPSVLSYGGPGFVQIDANGEPSIAAGSPGSGTVIHTTGALASGAMVVGNGGADLKTIGGSIGGAFTTAGPFTTSGASVGVTLAFPVNGPYTFTFPGASQTIASLAGVETFTNKIYSGGQLSGTFNGNPILTGVPQFSGLSAAVQTRCLGLDVSNNLVVLNAGCGSGGGSAWTITDGTHTVASVGQLTVTGGTIGGTTPNATLTIPGASGTVTQNGNLATNLIVTGGTNGTTDIKTNSTGTGVIAALAVNVGTAGAFAKNNGDALSGTYTGTPTFSGNLTFSGIPKFTGLSGGTATACLALDGVNNTIIVTCGGGSGSGTVNAGTGTQLTYYAATGTTVSGNSHLLETGSLHIVNYNAVALPAPTAGTVLQVGGADNTNTKIFVDAFGTGIPGFTTRSARGTAASPTASQLNDTILALNGLGRGATAYSASPRVSVGGAISENWTDAAQGTRLNFSTTTNTTTTTLVRAYIENDGGLEVNDVSGVAPTGGSKGPGSINVATALGSPAFYQQGTPLLGEGFDNGTNPVTVTTTGTVAATTRVENIGALSASIVRTLPAIGSTGLPAGGKICFDDLGTNVTPTHTLTVMADHADSINGGSSGGSIGPWTSLTENCFRVGMTGHNWAQADGVPTSNAPAGSVADGLGVNGLIYDTLSTIMDAALGSTQGSIIYRGPSTWAALGPGIAGQFLQTAGAGANTLWATSLAGNIPVNPQTGTTYTVVTGDQGKLVTLSNGSAVAVTLPQAGSTGFAANWGARITNLGAGTATITPTTSTFNGAATIVLTTGMSALIVSDGTNYEGAISVPTSGGGNATTSAWLMSGCQLSYNSTTVINIAACQAIDKTNTTVMTAGAFTKNVSATWASGSGNGALGNGITLANNTWYWICMVHTATPVTDYFVDTAIGCANPPASLTSPIVRPIFPFKTCGVGSLTCSNTASTNIDKFFQAGRKFTWNSAQLDANNVTYNNTPAALTLSVPPGLKVDANTILYVSHAADGFIAIYDADDSANPKDSSGFVSCGGGAIATNPIVNCQVPVTTSTSSGVLVYASSNTLNTANYINTVSYTLPDRAIAAY